MPLRFTILFFILQGKVSSSSTSVVFMEYAEFVRFVAPQLHPAIRSTNNITTTGTLPKLVEFA